MYATTMQLQVISSCSLSRISFVWQFQRQHVQTWLLKKKYVTHQQTTTNELKPPDLVQALTECGRVQHVSEISTLHLTWDSGDNRTTTKKRIIKTIW